MKIGILTFSYAVNRGAHMQCYALQTILEDMGHDVEIIHIELPSHALSLKGKINYFIQNLLNRRFRRKHYSKVTRLYRSADELRRQPPKEDIYIVGSDQVWNTSITYRFGADAFFLDFAPDNCRRIAYAASFGGSIWTSLGVDKDEKIRGLVNKFDGISVRELDGVIVCRNTFGREDVVPVIDPVFLLDNYKFILGNKTRHSNIVICYPLYANATTQNVTLQVSEDLHLATVSYSRAIRGRNIRYKLFSSIEGWLRAISGSNFIVTNSFHCMAFCIIFHKKFIVTPPAPGKETRMLSMLSQLGLEHRYVTSYDDFQNRKMMLYQDEDYSAVDLRLDTLRSKSISFLNDNI